MPRHDPQLIRWCNEDLSLPTYIHPDTVEEQFSTGYLYGCILYNIAPVLNIRLPDNYLKSFIQNDTTTATKVSNFEHVRYGLRLLNIPFDSTKITAICTEQRGAATGLLFQLKSAFDIVTGAVPSSSHLPSSTSQGSVAAASSSFGVTVPKTSTVSSASGSTRLRLAETVRDAPLVNQYLLAGMNPKQIAMALHLARFEEFRIETEKKAALLDAEEDKEHLQNIKSQQLAQAQKTQTHRAWGADFEATNKELHELEMSRMQDQERTDLAYELTMMEKRRILENNERVRSKYDAQSNITKFENNMRKMGLNPYGNNNHTALLATAGNAKDKLVSSNASTDGKDDSSSSSALSSIVTADQAHANYIHTSNGDVLKRGILGGVSTHTISHLAPRPLSRIADALFTHTHPHIDEVTRNHALASMDTLSPGTTPLLTTFDASITAQSQRKETPQEYLERMTVSFAVGFRSRDATVYNDELSTRIKEERNARRDKATRGRLMNSFQEKAAAAVEGRAAQDAEIVRLVEEARIQRAEAEAAAARKFAKQERIMAGIEWAKRQEEKLDARFQERVNRDRVRLEQERTLRLEEEAPAREARIKARAEIEATRHTANVEIVKDTIELLMDVALDVVDKLETAKETYGSDSVEAKGIVPSEWRSIKKSFVDGSIGTNRIIATIAQAREQVETGGKAMGLPVIPVAPDGLTAWGIVLGGNRVAGTSLSVSEATKVSPSAFFESQPPLPSDDVSTLLDYCDVHDWEAARGAWSLPKEEKEGGGSRSGSPLPSRPTSRRTSRSSSPTSLPNFATTETVSPPSVQSVSTASWMMDTTVKNESAAQTILTDFLSFFPSDPSTLSSLPFLSFTVPSPLRIVTAHQGSALPHSPIVNAIARRFRMLHITALDILLCGCFVFDDENRRLLDKSYGVPNHPIAALAIGPLVAHPSIRSIVDIWNQNHHQPTAIEDTKLFFTDFIYRSDKEKDEVWNQLYALGSTIAVYLSLFQRGSVRQRPVPSVPSPSPVVVPESLPPSKSRRGSTASVTGGTDTPSVDPNLFVIPPLPDHIDQTYYVKDEQFRAALYDASCTDPAILIQAVIQTRQSILDAQKASANGESVPNAAVGNAPKDTKTPTKGSDKGKDAGKDSKKDKKDTAVTEIPPPTPVVEMHPSLLLNILHSTSFAEGLSIYVQQAERYITSLRSENTVTSLGGYNGWIMDNLLASPMHMVAIEYALHGSLIWTPTTVPGDDATTVEDSNNGTNRNVRFEPTVSPYVPSEWDGKSLSTLLPLITKGTFTLPKMGKEAIELWDTAAKAAKIETETIAAAEALAAQQAAEALNNPPSTKTPTGSRPGSQAASKPSSAASTKKPGSAKSGTVSSNDAHATALIPPARPAAEALAAMGPRPLLSCSIDIVLSIPTIPLSSSSYAFLNDNDTHDIYVDGLTGLPISLDTVAHPLVPLPSPEIPNKETTPETEAAPAPVPAPTGSRPGTSNGKAKPPTAKGKTEEPSANTPPSPLSVLSTLLLLPKMRLILPFATVSSSLESFAHSGHAFVTSWMNQGLQKGSATITSVDDGNEEDIDILIASAEMVIEYLSQAFTTTPFTINQKLLLSLSRGNRMDIRLLQNTLRAYRTCNNAYTDTATYLLSRIRDLTQHTRSHIRRLARSFLRFLRGLPDASIPLNYLGGLPVVPSSVEQLTNTMRTTRIRAAEVEAMKSNYRNQTTKGSVNDDSNETKYGKHPLLPMPTKGSHIHRRDTVQITDRGIITPELRKLAEKVASLDIKDSMQDIKYIESLCQEADEAAATYWSSMEKRRDAAVEYLDALRNDGWILDIQYILYALTCALVHIATRRTQDSAAFVIMVEEQLLRPVQAYYGKLRNRIRDVQCTERSTYPLNVTLDTPPTNNANETSTADDSSSPTVVNLDIPSSIQHHITRLPAYHDVLVQGQSSLRTLLQSSASSSASSRASAGMAASRAWRTIVGTTNACFRLHTNIQRVHTEAIDWCDRNVHIWLQGRDNAIKQVIQRIQTVLRAGANPVLYETRIHDEKRQAKLLMLATTQRNANMVALSDHMGRGNGTAGSQTTSSGIGPLSRSVSAGKLAVSSTDGARGIALPKLSPIDFVIPNEDGIAEVYGWVELPEKEDLLAVNTAEKNSNGTKNSSSSASSLSFGSTTGPVYWDGPQVSSHSSTYRFDEAKNNSSQDSFSDFYNDDPNHSNNQGNYSSSSAAFPSFPSTLSEAITIAETILTRFSTAIHRPLRPSTDNGMNSSSASSATLALTMSRQAKEIEKTLTSTVVLPPSIRTQHTLTECPTGYAVTSQSMECTHPQLRLTGKGILAVTRAFMDTVVYAESTNPSNASSIPNTRDGGLSTGRSHHGNNSNNERSTNNTVNGMMIPSLALSSQPFHDEMNGNTNYSTNQSVNNASRTLANVFLQAVHNLSEEFGNSELALEHIPSAWLQAPSSVWLSFTRTYAKDTVASVTNNTLTYGWDIVNIRRFIIGLVFTRLRSIPSMDQLVLFRRNLARVDDDHDGYITQAQYLNSLLFYETTMERATETLVRQDKDRVIANKAAIAAGKTVSMSRSTNNGTNDKTTAPKSVRTVSYDKPHSSNPSLSPNNASYSSSSSFAGNAPIATMTVSPEAAVAQGGARDMDNVLRQTLLSLTPSSRFLDAACIREILWILYTDKGSNVSNNYTNSSLILTKGYTNNQPSRLDVYALLFDLCTDPRTTHSMTIPLTGGMVQMDGKTSFPSSAYINSTNSLHSYRRSSLEQLGIFTSSTNTNNSAMNHPSNSLLSTLQQPSLGDTCIAGALPSVSVHAGWHSYHPILRGTSRTSPHSSSSLSSPSGSSPSPTGSGSHHGSLLPGVPRIPGLLKAMLIIADAENIIRDEHNQGQRKHPLYIGISIRSFCILLGYSVGLLRTVPVMNSTLMDTLTIQQQLLSLRTVNSITGQEYSFFEPLVTYLTKPTPTTNLSHVTLDTLITLSETVLNRTMNSKDSMEYTVGMNLLQWFYTLPFGICSVGNPCDTVPLEM